MQAIFAKFDVDGNNEITFHELLEGAQRMHRVFSRKETDVTTITCPDQDDFKPVAGSI